MGKGENKASVKGMVHKRTDTKQESVRGIEDEHGHAGEKGPMGGVCFKLPKDGEITDHSKVRSLD
jgi:hypothetical protein